MRLTETIERVLDAKTELGEGPVWDPIEACLYFVDIVRSHIHRFEPDSGVSRTYAVDMATLNGPPHTNVMVGAVAPTEAGDLVLAVRDGFARLDLDTGHARMIAEVEAGCPDQRMNDGKCDPAGRFWAGTMALDERPCAGALYRLDPDGRVHTMQRDITISNGLGWSDDGRLMYFIDTPTQSLDVFDFDVASGAIANRRTLARVPAGQGSPDGLTLDAEGYVWVSLWAGSAVHRYAPDGTLDRVMPLPVTHPTSCTFGGRDLRDLYITTAAIALTPDARARQPLAGSLLRCRPGVQGRPAHRFRG
jgi:sugar lactone lactonase YvrE